MAGFLENCGSNRTCKLLERLQEVDQVLHLLLRQTNLEALVIEVDDLLQIARDAVVEARGTRRQSSQDKALAPSLPHERNGALVRHVSSVTKILSVPGPLFVASSCRGSFARIRTTWSFRPDVSRRKIAESVGSRVPGWKIATVGRRRNEGTPKKHQNQNSL